MKIMRQGPDRQRAAKLLMPALVLRRTKLRFAQCPLQRREQMRERLRVIPNMGATARAAPAIVTAALTNGASLQAHFSGGAPAVIAALSPKLSIAAGVTLSWTVQALVLNNGQPAAGQSVSWQSGSSGLTAQSTSGAITNSSGLATRQLTVGPLAEGQLITINACLNGTSQCVTYTALGARAEYASLTAVSGVSQSISVQSTPSQVTLRIIDMDGNPMAGGSVVLYQALYAWSPPCSAKQVCTPGNLLATQVSTAASAIDGTVTFTPASFPGTPTTASVSITVEQHP